MKTRFYWKQITVHRIINDDDKDYIYNNDDNDDVNNRNNEIIVEKMVNGTGQQDLVLEKHLV